MMKTQSLRILMISKALIVGAYHKKLEELSGLGADLHVIIPRRWGDRKPEISEGRGYSIESLPAVFHGKNHFHFYRHLHRTVQRIRPAIIHIDEESYSLVTYEAMRIAVANTIPALFFNWQNICKKHPWPFSYFEKYNFTHASAGIAGSREIKDVLLKKKCRTPLFVIPQFGVDTDVYCRTPQHALRKSIVGDGAFTIGYAGRFVEEKGIGTLIETFKKLPDNVHMILVGSGPLKEKLRRQASLFGATDRLHIIDQVGSADMPRYLNIMDCLVLPSLTFPNWKEQFGRILIEAMACEVPVIGSTAGEIPNVIGKSGFLFTEGSSAELAELLQILIRDDSRRVFMAKNGRERVLVHYTQKKIARDTLDVYRFIMENVKGR
jgi:glycosyltransferase involved in cell wall biosynthesis